MSPTQIAQLEYTINNRIEFENNAATLLEEIIERFLCENPGLTENDIPEAAFELCELQEEYTSAQLFNAQHFKAALEVALSF